MKGALYETQIFTGSICFADVGMRIANGTMQFVGLSQAGMQLLFVIYGPGNKNDMLVAIHVTNLIGIPTMKP